MKKDPKENFLGLYGDDASYEKASVAVQPVPYEETVSYGRGTAKGPRAILDASQQVELYDEELDCEPFDVGVATLDALDVKGVRPDELTSVVEPAISKILDDGKLPISFGGEHSITPAIVAAVSSKYDGLTVVGFDAHADLRQEYEGERMSHACAMARVREMAPAVQLGIRNLSKEEMEWVRRDRLPVFFAHSMRECSDWSERALDAIQTENVYITVDLDAFDQSIMSATGTPEPGGMDWYAVTDFIRLVARERKVVGFDIVELAPQEGLHACDFLAAKLAYKCIGYWREGRG